MIESGIIPGIEFEKAMYYSDSIIKPKGVMLHSNSSDRDFSRYVTHYHTPTVSYHLTQNAKLEVIQHVPLNKRAWHAGRDNGAWVGFCLHGPNNRFVDPLDLRCIAQVLHGFKQVFDKEPALTFHRWRKTTKQDPGQFDDIPALMKALGYKNLHYTSGGCFWRR